ncbi:hypothetical protein [Candidatus Bathycorpusculum sp.]|uniref:hypothetical protein n=1 Tax=Candidatus Bathycorpusculum sp. TaxID=2994959 RepID=UPI00281EE2D6|nr:hypothetical protein [Candidatus Termitimicrobium sp.]MCL2685931.1 hypothetical protein [Candidatus Termitimicrobium sp.]
MTSILFVCLDCDESFTADKASYKTIIYYDAEGTKLASDDRVLVCPHCLQQPGKIYLTETKLLESAVP